MKSFLENVSAYGRVRGLLLGIRNEIFYCWSLSTGQWMKKAERPALTSTFNRNWDDSLINLLRRSKLLMRDNKCFLLAFILVFISRNWFIVSKVELWSVLCTAGTGFGFKLFVDLVIFFDYNMHFESLYCRVVFCNSNHSGLLKLYQIGIYKWASGLFGYINNGFFAKAILTDSNKTIWANLSCKFVVRKLSAFTDIA